MKNWRKLAALCMIGALVFAFAACTTTPDKGNTEPATEPSTEPTGDSTGLETGAPLVDPETYKDFVGTWYADGSSAGYRINITDKATWQFTDASQETIFSGGLMVNEDNQSITLYDPDGVQALDITMDEAGKIYVEVYVESLMDTLSTNYFLNEITNDNQDFVPVGDDDVEVIVPSDDSIVDGTGSEDAAG